MQNFSQTTMTMQPLRADELLLVNGGDGGIKGILDWLKVNLDLDLNELYDQITEDYHQLGYNLYDCDC